MSVHSELEVLNVANNWLKHDIEKRSKFAKQLLLTIRLSLLSDHALRYILTNTSIFTENKECINVIKNILFRNKNFFQSDSSKDSTNRYCNQETFNILVCGGKDGDRRTIRNVTQVYGSKLNYMKVLPSFLKQPSFNAIVSLKGELYIFKGHPKIGVRKYSFFTNTWNKVANMCDDRTYFCVCAFMNHLFVVGGLSFLDASHTWISLYSCLKFDAGKNKWKKVAATNAARWKAACAVFQGNIVVSGGIDNDNVSLKTVECYDVVADEWTSMPSMIESKILHSLVVVKNKLFAIGGTRSDTCEVFDNTCRKFVAFKSPPLSFRNKAVSVGNKILVFHNSAQSIACYNVDKEEWSEESCEATKRRDMEFFCIKLPRTSLDIDDCEKVSLNVAAVETGAAEIKQIRETENCSSSESTETENISAHKNTSENYII